MLDTVENVVTIHTGHRALQLLRREDCHIVVDDGSHPVENLRVEHLEGPFATVRPPNGGAEGETAPEDVQASGRLLRLAFHSQNVHAR